MSKNQIRQTKSKLTETSDNPGILIKSANLFEELNWPDMSYHD